MNYVDYKEFIDNFFLIHQNIQKSMTSLNEIEKIFSSRRSLYLHRFVKLANFICNRCNLEKTSKLVVYVKNKENESLCNDCYNNLLFISKKQNEAQ